jgi:hypothetical protein
MSMLDILAKVANEFKKIPITNRRTKSLIKARAKISEIRCKRKQKATNRFIKK